MCNVNYKPIAIKDDDDDNDDNDDDPISFEMFIYLWKHTKYEETFFFVWPSLVVT